MKKTRTKSINQLQLEILELDKQITKAISSGKPAFASRLSSIRETKSHQIKKWMDD